MTSTANPDLKARKNGKPSSSDDILRAELLNDANQQRALIQLEWLQDMTANGSLVGVTAAESEAQLKSLYDTNLECLESGEYHAAEEYALRMAKLAVQGVGNMERILLGMMTLRDIRVRRLIKRYAADPDRLSRVLDFYIPFADKISLILAVSFPAERERVMRQQQEVIKELSTPVLRVHDRLLILPIIGLLDSDRARQLTTQLLEAIREFRALVVVMDVTGVAAVDSKVANHLIQTVEAARLLGATVIVTGLSPAIAQTIVTIGVDLSRVQTVGDLQGGIDLADRLLGFRLVFEGAGSGPAPLHSAS